MQALSSLILHGYLAHFIVTSSAIQPFYFNFYFSYFNFYFSYFFFYYTSPFCVTDNAINPNLDEASLQTSTHHSMSAQTLLHSAANQQHKHNSLNQRTSAPVFCEKILTWCVDMMGVGDCDCRRPRPILFVTPRLWLLLRLRCFQTVPDKAPGAKAWSQASLPGLAPEGFLIFPNLDEKTQIRSLPFIWLSWLTRILATLTNNYTIQFLR